MSSTQEKKNRRTRQLTRSVTIRFTTEDFEHLELQATFAGISVSAFIRKKISGAAIVPQADLTMIRELKRIGGLLKHHFTTLRDIGASPEILLSQEETLALLRSAIAKIGAKYDS